MADRPAASVVVASFRRLEVLADSLNSLRPQCEMLGAELVVARAGGADEPGLRQVAAGCRVVDVRVNATVPELRGAGLAAAAGEWVALTEDHCLADPAWLTTLLEASEGARILGGSMGNAHPERGIDCGAFFAEYGFFGATGAGARAHAPPLITQANAAYHRSVVPQVAEWASQGTWENVIHDRLYAAKQPFRLVAAARVSQNLHYRLGAFCRDRFQHGHGFAAARAAGLSWWKRAALAAATPALPLILSRRILRSMADTERASLPRGFAPMLLFLSAWAVGEAAGYVGLRS